MAKEERMHNPSFMIGGRADQLKTDVDWIITHFAYADERDVAVADHLNLMLRAHGQRTMVTHNQLERMTKIAIEMRLALGRRQDAGF